MSKYLLKDGFLWGFLLWLTGYILGFIFFAFVPQSIIGWFVMPIGILITLWVLIKKIKGRNLQYYLLLGVAWTLIAVAFDYLFIVKMLRPEDGYYKPDVYLYYLFTLTLPLIVGWRKNIKGE